MPLRAKLLRCSQAGEARTAFEKNAPDGNPCKSSLLCDRTASLDKKNPGQGAGVSVQVNLRDR